MHIGHDNVQVNKFHFVVNEGYRKTDNETQDHCDLQAVGVEVDPEQLWNNNFYVVARAAETNTDSVATMLDLSLLHVILVHDRGN